MNRLGHALYTLMRRLRGKPDYGFGSVPRGALPWQGEIARGRAAALREPPTVCDPTCGPMWTPGYCDDDCPNAPPGPTSWAAERAQVLAPSADK